MSDAEIAVALWDAYQARDWEAARALLRDDAVLDWPCTEERLVGGDAIVAVNRQYPEGWSIAVLRWDELGPGLVSVLARVDHPPHRFWAHSRVHVEQQKIVHLEEYWSMAEAPPAWREGFPGLQRTTPAPERFHLQEADPALLATERARVRVLLEGALPWAEVHEVGSTAVDGLLGKQDLDWLVRVPAERFAEARRALDRALPRHPDQLSNAQYQGYRVPAPMDVAVQLTVAGGPHDDFLSFLDALRRDPALRERYNALKREFDGALMEQYRQAKGAFVQQATVQEATRPRSPRAPEPPPGR
jgi:GrpB-like predicted nucleotidyltransferase (UPF0157 family)